MTNPVVSIITTTYNEPSKVDNFIAQLNKQTFENFELIIINNCGRKLDDIIAKYSSLNIYTIDLLEKQTDVYGKNRAIAYSRGKFIFLLNIDSILKERDLVFLINEMNLYDFISLNKGHISYGCFYKKNIHRKLGYFSMKSDNWQQEFFGKVMNFYKNKVISL